MRTIGEEELEDFVVGVVKVEDCSALRMRKDRDRESDAVVQGSKLGV